MAEEIIQARLWTKVDTLDNWNNNPLLLGPGELALVTNGQGVPMNMKWGDKTTRKRFSDLPFAIAYDQGQFIAVTGTVLPASTAGQVRYSLVGEGTYTRAGQSDVVVPTGYMGIIVDDGNAWTLGSTVTLPIQEVSNAYGTRTDVAISENKATETKNRVDTLETLSDFMPFNKYAVVFPNTRVNNLNLWGDSRMKFSKAKTLRAFYVASNEAGNILVKLITISGSTATIISEITLTVAVGINTFTPQQLGIGSEFYNIYPTQEIYPVLTNTSASGFQVVYKADTGQTGISFPVAGGAITSNTNVNLGAWIGVNADNNINKEFSAVNSQLDMVSTEYSQVIPRIKNPADYTSKSAYTHFWTDPLIKLGYGKELEELNVIGSNSGDIVIALATINGSTATILYQKTVSVPNSGLNTITASQIAIPEGIYDNEEVYILASNNNTDYPTNSRLNYKAGNPGQAMLIQKSNSAVSYGPYDFGIYANIKIKQEKELPRQVNILKNEVSVLKAKVTTSDQLQDFIMNNRRIDLTGFSIELTQALVVPSNTLISGVRGSSIIRLPAGGNFNIFNFDVNSSDITIRDLTLDGRTAISPVSVTRDDIINRTGIGTNNGIYINGYAKNIHIEGLEIKNFNGAGINMYRTHSGQYTRTTKITNNVCINNGIGCLADVRSEYQTVIGNSFTYNKYGAIFAGGNMLASTNHMDANGVGCVISGILGENDSHGSISCSTFNHNISYSLYVIDINNGFAVSGSQVFQGDICLDNAKGFIYSSGEIAAAVRVVNENTSYNSINNNIVIQNYGGGTIEGTKVSKFGNRFMDGSDSSSINNNV